MRNKTSRHVIAAYFSSELAAGAQVAVKRLRHEYREARVELHPPEARAAGLYTDLRLPGETIVVARVPRTGFAAATQILQTAGARSIFLFPLGLARPADVMPSPAAALPLGARAIRQRLDQLRDDLTTSHEYLIESVRVGHAASPASQWVLDNIFSIELSLTELQDGLAPACRALGRERANAVWQLAQRLLDETSFAATAASISRFLETAQQDRPLDSLQLWSFPLLIRLALVESLVALAARARRVQQLREAAFLWADRLNHAARLGALDVILGRLEVQPFLQESSFCMALAEQLQDQETALHGWMDRGLCAPLGDLVRVEHAREAREASLASNAFNLLRNLGGIDFRKVFDQVSHLERTLREDPAGSYPASDFRTRDALRQVVSRVAAQSGHDELDIARRTVALARLQAGTRAGHVLYYAFASGVLDLERDAGARPPLGQRLLRAIRLHGLVLYLLACALFTAIFLGAALSFSWGSGIQNPWLLCLLGVLAAILLSELATQVLQSLVMFTFPPEPIPRLDYTEGIPADQATLVVVPMMFTSEASIRQDVEKLEVRYLSNPEENLSFALLADFVDHTEAVEESDDALLAVARQGIAALNERHGARFLLFHRGRNWSATQQMWIGRERKRGKVEDLNAWICGAPNQLIVFGELPRPPRYVITLDADTSLPPRSAVRLIETIAHPLNRVEINPTTGVRASGYAVVQPRVAIALPRANATRFTRVFSDAWGSDPYCTVISDAQQDLFREGIFHGKAIYDVAAFHTILSDRFPPETILSHDLIEGAHLGVCYASDIELLESVPLTYASYAMRQHRWLRGDWQILDWIFPTVPAGSNRRIPNPLSGLNRWRILDNLRRSLVPLSAFLLLVFGWFFSVAPSVWSVVIAVAAGIPAFVPLLDRFSRTVEGSTHGWRGAADDLKRASVMLVFLPHQAWVSADAIARALYRRRVSGRNLLEWQSAEAADTQSFVPNRVLRQLLVISALSLAALLALKLQGSFRPASAFLVAWILAPALAHYLGRPLKSGWAERLDAVDRAYLRRVARLTWRYFDDLVGAASHWLPPDNSQLSLNVEVAERTSPTNIGLWLNSALSSCDFGYLTVEEFAVRTGHTLDTMQQLERYEGHILNWIHTGTLETLRPAYVSTVDSGNLIAALWVYEEGCRDLRDMPVLPAACRQGLLDSVLILATHAGEDPSVRLPLEGLRSALEGERTGIEVLGQIRLAGFHVSTLREPARWSVEGDETGYWIRKLIDECGRWNAQIDRYLGWLEALSRPSSDVVRGVRPHAVALRAAILSRVPTFRELAAGPSEELQALLHARTLGLPPQLVQWLDVVEREFESASRAAQALCASLDNLAFRAAAFAASINMRLLYDAERRVFAIGYTVGEPLTFSSHYDLLASECRLASLIAIAKGDVPIDHWFALARPRVSSPSRQALLSWSGTLFEYLMPLVYTQAFENSLLQRACREAVDAQIAYGRAANLPWGISESAYGAIDARRTYQYKAFGIPQLALNPSADPGPVVAPYATLLALMVRPLEALENLRRLEPSLLGNMGFYEAIDYTRSSHRDEEPGLVIFAYMAHHQGMSYLSIHDALEVGITPRARFHRLPRIRAVESLLFERVPIARVESEEIARPVAGAEPVFTQDRTWVEPTPLPHVFLSSIGQYALMVSSNGGGYGRWRGFEITRWRADTALDDCGTTLWLRELRSQTQWRASHPHVGPGESMVTFAADRAEILRRVEDLESKLEITTTTEDEGEFRQLIITNRGLRLRQVEVTTYTELALAPARSDAAHPAFSRMFVETESPEPGVLLATRRRRSPEDPAVWVAAVLSGVKGSIAIESDRRAFLGRNRPVNRAAALGGKLTGTTGAVLDPVFAFRFTLRLEPRDQRHIGLTLLVAGTREELMAAVRRHQAAGIGQRVLEMAWARAQLEFRHLRIGSAAAHRFQELAASLIYPNPSRRPTPRGSQAGPYGQRELWRFGISGDLPILTLSVADSAALEIVREVLLAKAYWRLRGFETDLILLNRETQSYAAPLAKSLTRLLEAHHADGGPQRPGRAFLIQWTALDEFDQALLLASSRIALGAHRGPLRRQLLSAPEPAAGIRFVPRRTPPPQFPTGALPALELTAASPYGGFTPAGDEYVIHLEPGASTPQPWSNVIANPSFGTVVTERGLGFTWSRNSQQNRLTPWHNDPVADRQSEILYLRDETYGGFWSATPSPGRARAACCVTHGQGYSQFTSTQAGIHHRITVTVAQDEPVKIITLDLTNESGTAREITAYYFVEWVLGSSREVQQGHVYTAWQPEHGLLSARQSWTGPFRGQVAFVASQPRAESHTGDRLAFVGRPGSLEEPAALGRAALDNHTGFALDPCGALQVRITLPPEGSERVTFLLGAAASYEDAARLVSHFSPKGAADAELTAVREAWTQRQGALQVQTPDASLNILLNRWLLYQVLSCRMWARSAFYQSGGAFGFRDQLQDSLALLYAAPAMTRQQILNAASHQFPPGDVLHWWHPYSGLGVRTRCSDDLLWLPWGVAKYLDVTGDHSILDEELTFVDGPVLEPHQHEQLVEAKPGTERASLLEHCVRAIEYGSRFGPHGLPLIGNGDWNDGMNHVGVEGRGESVWLAWFLIDVLNKWSALDAVPADRRALWRERAERIRQAVEEHAWDGDWYLRGYFDDGSPLGSARCEEAQIDSLPQSWAAITGAGDSARTTTALASARRRLLRADLGAALLFTPAFDHSRPHPGYIMGYPPGIRENGGQYTHGAIWLAQAHAALGDGTTAATILNYCSPAHRNYDTYRGEPYAVAADIYASALQPGSAGWTWYTGSAAWLYRVWLEDVLGFRLRGNTLSLHPALPDGWEEVKLNWRYRSASYEIEIRRGTGSESRVEVDGVRVQGGVVTLQDDGAAHFVLVVTSTKPAPAARSAQESGSALDAPPVPR